MLQETTTLASSDLTKRKEEVSTPGRERRATCTKESLREVREMEGAPSGGRMAAGMKGISEMECSQDGECCIVKAGIKSIRAIGTTACLTARAPNIFRTARDTRALSRRTNSTETAFFTKMTRSFTVYGRTTSYRWSTWSRAVWATSDCTPFNRSHLHILI